jgi:hypothetical protein
VKWEYASHKFIERGVRVVTASPGRRLASSVNGTKNVRTMNTLKTTNAEPAGAHLFKRAKTPDLPNDDNLQCSQNFLLFRRMFGLASSAQ